MIRTSSHQNDKLGQLLQSGHTLWILYLDIVKFHEVEFRQGYRICNQILQEIEEEIRQTLTKHTLLFHAAFLDYQGGDDFILFLAPGKNTPWNIAEVINEWVNPLEMRINQRIKPFVSETIRLHSGLVECKPQPGRSVDYLLYGALKEAFLLNKSEPDPLYFARREELNRILEEPEKYVRSAFQPILDVTSGEFFGFEALARLNPPSSFSNIAELFPFSEKIGKLYPIETICRKSAISQSPNILRSKEYLFLNVDPQVLSDSEFSSGQTRKLLADHGLTPSDVILELTERSAIRDFKTFREALEHYRKQGYLIALDDVGAGYSSLQSIAELHPDFLKIDRSLIEEIHLSPTKWALLDTFVTFSHRIGCRILAEGVETEEEMQTVIQLGVDFVQGYYIAKPSFNRPEIDESIRKIVRSRQNIKIDSEKSILPLLEALPFFDPGTTVGVVDNYFREHPNIWLVGVSHQERLLGVIQRDKFYTALATRYGVSLYLDRPLTWLMDRKPLIIEDTTPVEVASSLAMARTQGQLYDGIVVIRKQKPIGMIRIASLIKAMSEAQIQIARGANPLTGLPGNIAIEQEIKRRLNGGIPFGIIYADLNHFKLFNDVYGFQQGDAIIKLLGEILLQETSTFDIQAFVGHVGGDDFIIILDESRIKTVGENLLSCFQKRIETVHGSKNLSLSLAGIVIPANDLWTISSISERVATLKIEAKLPQRNFFLIKDFRR
jgi:diguanylate cyclase (GGDEF)-like protein